MARFYRANAFEGAPVRIPEPAPAPAARRPAHKTPVRRPDRSRIRGLRRLFQILFLGLNVWIGIQFFLFVRFFETGGQSLRVARPPGVEGWLPIAGLMNLKYLLTTGQIPAMHPAAMFLLAAFLLISLVFRKAFCSWLCPVGTVSELLCNFGRDLLKRNFTLPRWIDLPLRSLKYVLLGLFVYAVAGMSAAAIAAFLSSPYGLVADVKMLQFFREMSRVTAITLAALLILSLLFKNFWCRYLCPYGALMGLAAIFSPSRIQRDSRRCIGCARCAKACPALLPVDRLAGVRSAECTGCLECIAACPAEGALQMSFARRRKLPAWLMAAGISVLFLGVVAFAQWNGTWGSDIPDWVYHHLLPRLERLSHP